MDFQDCVKFANENHPCYIATVEGDQPRVRAIGLWYADETGFYIQTQTYKDFARQMEKNNKIEICFYSRQTENPTGKTMLRVSGKVEPVTDMECRRRCIEERPVVKRMGIEKPEDPILAIFRLYTGEAYFFPPESGRTASEIEKIRF